MTNLTLLNLFAKLYKILLLELHGDGQDVTSFNNFNFIKILLIANHRTHTYGLRMASNLAEYGLLTTNEIE